MSECSAEKARTDDLIAELRQRLSEGWCLCSSAHTDWQGVEALLDRLERAEAMHAEAFRIGIAKQERLAAVEALAEEWGEFDEDIEEFDQYAWWRRLNAALSTPPGKPGSPE